MEVKNVILDDKTKARLKGFLAFQTEANFTYVPKAFRDKNAKIDRNLWPVFTLRSKNGIDVAEAEDKAGFFEYDEHDKNKSRLIMNSGSARIHTLRKGIIKVKNLITEDGKIFSFDLSKEQNIDDLIKMLPIKLQVELQEAINERSILAPDELLGLE
jgi:hypothetical protein